MFLCVRSLKCRLFAESFRFRVEFAFTLHSFARPIDVQFHCFFAMFGSIRATTKHTLRETVSYFPTRGPRAKSGCEHTTKTTHNITKTSDQCPLLLTLTAHARILKIEIDGFRSGLARARVCAHSFTLTSRHRMRLRNGRLSGNTIMSFSNMCGRMMRESKIVKILVRLRYDSFTMFAGDADKVSEPGEGKSTQKSSIGERRYSRGRNGRQRRTATLLRTVSS